MIQESSSDCNAIPAPKKRKYQNFNVKPFPIDCKLSAIFTGLDVEVFDKKSIAIIMKNGCYGNNALDYRQRYSNDTRVPIVTQAEYQRKLEWKDKFQAAENESRKILVDETVVVDPFNITQSYVLILEEAMFLHKELNCLEIKDIDEKIMSTENLWREFCEIKHNFVECYVGYLYLKSKNWVIKSGIKFGGHFLLYKHGPQYYHASYIVKIVTADRSCYEHQTNERIGEVTKKTMLYLEIHHPENIDSSKYLQNLHKFTVKEVAIRRYDVKEKFMS